MIGVALQALVVVMMASIGFEVRVTQLVGGLRGARWVLGAAALNLAVFPAVVWALAEGTDLSTGMATGLILCAAAPAGPIGPVLSKLSNSDLAFSTGLMVLLGVLGLFTTPLTVQLALGDHDGGIFVPMFTALLVFQVMPLVVAMLVASRLPGLAGRLAKVFGLAANVLLVGIVIALLILRGDVLSSTSVWVHAWLAGGILVVLAPILRMSPPGSMLRSLLTVTAVRNMSVALFLASRFFDDPAVEATILLWSFWMILLPGAVGVIAGRFRTSEKRPDAPVAEPLHRPETPPVCPVTALARVGLPASFIRPSPRRN